MTEKTRGIVLNYTRYTDHSGIVSLFTLSSGRKAYLVRNVGKKKKNNPPVMFQPLMILDLEASARPNSDMGNIISCSLSYIPATIPFNISRSTVSVFLAEVLNASIRDEQADKPLFSFLEESVILLDSCTGGYSNFHILFLVKLSQYLGFGPSPATGREHVFFDMINGLFLTTPPLSGTFMKPDDSKILSMLINTPLGDLEKLCFTPHQRKSILEEILRFYSIHIPGFRNIKSLKILQEVFT